MTLNYAGRSHDEAVAARHKQKQKAQEQGKRLGPTVSSFARASGMMVLSCRSLCRSREIVSMIGDRGHDPSKSIQIYPVESVGGVRGFSL
jgi:hypothetical protein